MRTPTSAWCAARLRAQERGGFTLVELLVSVSIFLVLASLAFGAFSVALEGDRGPAASRNFRAWIEGAKSRAAKLGRPVGIRPIINPNELNGHAARQFEYVASVEPIEGNLAYIEHLIWENSGQQISQWRVGQLTSVPVGRVTEETPDAVLWSSLNGDAGELNLLRPGARIEIPRDSGNWFYIAADDPRTTTYNEFGPDHTTAPAGPTQTNYLTLVGEFPLATFGSGPFDSANNVFTEAAAAPDDHFTPIDTPGASGGTWSVDPTAGRFDFVPVPELPGPPPTFLPPIYLPQPSLTYRLELGLDTLEGERTLTLPGGMFVDLDASTAPRPAAPTDAYAPEPLIFSPTGEVIGAYQQAGLLSFYFANRDEVTLAQASPGHPLAMSAADFMAWQSFTRPGLVPIRSEPVGDPQVLTLLPKTGFIQKSSLIPTDADTYAPGDASGTPSTVGTPDGFADQPYSVRLRGDLDR